MEAGGSVEMATSVAGLRKGAWSGDEDRLLRKCVDTFGEGRWHLVPLRAGLNRCRKSCRLRWLNYLKPNIKRGEFSNDEIDLMARLHKLLGNRWALIAGRLPGRTANDVKNYWNTHQRKTSPTTSFQCKTALVSSNIDSRSMEITKTNIIKPRPWTFSSKGFVLPKKITTTEPRNPNVNIDVSKKRRHSSSDDDGGEISMWVDSLETLLDGDEDVVGVNDNGKGKEIDVEDIGTSVDPMFDYDNQSFWSDIDIRHLIGDNNFHPQL